MRKLWLAALAAWTFSLVWAADWPMLGGGPQHNGWARSERLIDRTNVSTLKLLYRAQVRNESRELHSLTAPIVNGNLITYRGFKEMLIFGASSGKIYSLDADLNKIIWESHLDYRADKPQAGSRTSACPGGLTSPVIMAGSSSALLHVASEASRIPAAAGVKPKRPSPYFPPLWQSVYPLRPTTLSELAALYTIGGDGYLHVINSSTGQDLLPALRFVPPNAKVTSLNLWENILYATTGDNCDSYQNALFAMDLLSREKTVAEFVPAAGGFSGLGGTAVGRDGTVYVQVTRAPGNAGADHREAVVALTPRDLKMKDYFVPDEKPVARNKIEAPGITPLLFTSQGKEMLLAGGRDGRLYLLDAQSLGGADHRTPLFASGPIAQADRQGDGHGLRGAFSSWIDTETSTRWFYAPIFGPPHHSAKLTPPKNAPANGSIVAFKLVEENAHPALQFNWLSRDIVSPAPVVIANGMVLVLATGETPRLASKKGKPYSIAELEQLAGKATLFAFDAVTGKQLYSSGDAVSASASGGSLAVANGRVYFNARDTVIYCFGLPNSESQLKEQ